MTKIKLGKYQHYKGNLYEVIGEGRHSETTEEMVVYKALYESEFGKNGIGIRPKKMFFENVVVEGMEVPRFRKVETKKNTAENFEAHLAFLKEIEKLKQVERAILTSSLQRYENSAEHSWHVALFLLVFQHEFPDANLLKMLKMILIHDLVEIYAGDTPAFDMARKGNQKEREQIAAEKLYALLPSSLHEEFWALKEEFELQETPESKIARSCDNLQAMLQSILSKGITLRTNKITAAWVENYHKPYNEHHPVCKLLYEKLLSEIKEKKLSWEG